MSESIPQYQAARDAFGTVGTAMITPFASDGALDLAGAAAVAEHLVDLGNNMLLVSGTTGESPTTTDSEKYELVAEVVRAVGDRARIVAGVGTNDTQHSIQLAEAARKAGAHGLLVVAPYYSKPSQEGLIAHVRAIAGSTELPIMLYDIPGRSAIEFATQTLSTLDEIPNVLAVKDAKGDVFAASQVMARSQLAYYSGEDALNLPLLVTGAIGVVSVVGHVAADRYAAMVAAVEQGDLPNATRLHQETIPLVEALMTKMPGVVAAKAALELQGIITNRATRLPLLSADEAQSEAVRSVLSSTGYLD